MIKRCLTLENASAALSLAEDHTDRLSILAAASASGQRITSLEAKQHEKLDGYVDIPSSIHAYPSTPLSVLK